MYLENQVKSCFLVILLFGFSSVAMAGTGDVVEEVFSCGKDVAIKMQNTGWVVV